MFGFDVFFIVLCVTCFASLHLSQDPERPGFIQCFDPCTLQRLGEIKAMDADDVEDVVRRCVA